MGTLGALQILIWGSSYFLLAVLAEPISAETGWSRQQIYGGLSLGVFVAGLLAPACGRFIARNGGRQLLCASGPLVAVGLATLAASHSLVSYFIAWFIIGIGMALGLFEVLFATLGQTYGSNAKSAMTKVTLCSGFCTSIMWPLTAFLLDAYGWRWVCVIYAFLMLALVWPLYRSALPPYRPEPPPARSDTTGSPNPSASFTQIFVLVMLLFSLSGVLMAALSVLLITLLQGVGYTLAGAVAVGALMGPAQVGVRVIDLAFRNANALTKTKISVSLSAVGMLMTTLVPSTAAIGMVLYGAGNGLRTIVRGTLPLMVWTPSDYPVIMGRIARPALIAQAVTPLVGGYVLEHAGTKATWMLLSSLTLVNVALVWRLSVAMRQAGCNR
ncbi:MFS transporter [Pseudomonas matsuisoli]|uniref:MFS transporter n=2 Tax=Pseudomonas matsuisoli TaxID=1515666 RepID=A0A917UUP4_9PSED|nr:MFS transporter [Pseudomonas matsuisoli]